jgi:hypothetical protein
MLKIKILNHFVQFFHKEKCTTINQQVRHMMMSKTPCKTGAEFNSSIVFMPKIAATFDPIVVTAVQLLR